MNRQTKRMMQRQKATPADGSEQIKQRRSIAPQARQRTSFRAFLKEVRAELRKVNWPTRQELIGYSIVVIVSVTVLTAYVFGLDLFFSKSVLRFLGG